MRRPHIRRDINNWKRLKTFAGDAELGADDMVTEAMRGGKNVWEQWIREFRMHLYET